MSAVSMPGPMEGHAPHRSGLESRIRQDPASIHGRPRSFRPRRIPRTPLVDRVCERAELARWFAVPDVRLVNLLGPGGIGKSRLALAVAHDFRHNADEEVIFVELDEARDAAQALPCILTALGVPADPGEPVETRIIAALQRRTVFLVLDNLEHLRLGGFMVHLLTSCPGVRLLATSRSPLCLPEEHRYPVLPLALPEVGWLRNKRELERAPATALFLQTARRSGIEVDLTVYRNCDAIVRICRLAEGVPLRIKHAALLLRTSSLSEIVDRMHDPLSCLQDGPDDFPARHRSLEASVRWSYDLLLPEERWLLQLLATIEGDFTADVVRRRAHVAAGGRGSFPAIVERLASLTEKHVLVRLDDDGITRYRLPAHIRAFAHPRTESLQRGQWQGE